MKTIGIMQPYFLPYIGYFQLLNKVDEYVLYDNIQFSKKGWIHRNRMLQNGEDVYFTLPLKKDSDYLNVNQRYLADSFTAEKIKILAKIKNNYLKAPFFKEVFPLVEVIFNFDNKNLFEFVYFSIRKIAEYLEIKTPIIISSSLGEAFEQLKSEDKVIAICKNRGASYYINAIGGLELYDKENFEKEQIQLNFIKTLPIQYQQFSNKFVPWLSILDVMMFNDKSTLNEYLNNFEIL